MYLRGHRRILITVDIGMDPFFAVLLGRYIVQNLEQHGNEIQPKPVRTLKIPDLYSEYREKGEGYAAFLGSSIVAKVGPSINYLSQCFSDDGCASFFFEGDLPRVPKQKLREQSRVRRERTFDDHRNVPGITMAFRCDLHSPTLTRNVMRFFA